MALLKRKLTEEEHRERNEKCCKQENSMKEKQPNAETECKQY